MEKLCSIGERRAFTSVMRALLLAICACNPALAATAPVEPEATPSIPALVVPDETMSFNVTFRGIEVADVQTAIGRPGWVGGKRSVIIKSRGKADGLIAMLGTMGWELESTVDLDAGTPITSHEKEWAEMAGEKEHHDRTDTSQTHDIHSAIATLRGWHATASEHREIRMQLGGGHFGIEIWPVGKGVINNRPAIKYEGTADHDVHFSIWISDDAARVPLRAETETELGTVGITLVDYG